MPSFRNLVGKDLSFFVALFLVIFFKPRVIFAGWSFKTVISVAFHLSTPNPLEIVWQKLSRTGCIQRIGACFFNYFYMTVQYSNSLTYVIQLYVNLCRPEQT
jgi:hypothetical protein